MKKIFIVAGEVSGDRLAAWYVHKLREQNPDVHIQAVGGSCLQEAGVNLFEHITALNVIGIVEIVRRLPYLLRFMRRLVDYIVEQTFDEVVVVDFPGFNLRLIKQLKKQNPALTITYLSPPQLWCWGAWRVKKLKKYCDRVIVMYPFEVAWYQKRGLTVEWHGSPVYEAIAPYRQPGVAKEPCIALIPGSRSAEIEAMLPLFLAAAQILLKHYPELKFVLPVASSTNPHALRARAERHKLLHVWDKIELVSDEHEKFSRLARCCAALSKPGTVTLELALLRVPTVIAFKISWLTYVLARPLIRVASMGLPNLLLGTIIAPEIIQFNCRAEVLAHEVALLYHDFLMQTEKYHQRMVNFEVISRSLSS
jgi:lipid-A-disaccharide synthase